jgi:hypothetical protein
MDFSPFHQGCRDFLRPAERLLVRIAEGSAPYLKRMAIHWETLTPHVLGHPRNRRKAVPKQACAHWMFQPRAPPCRPIDAYPMDASSTLPPCHMAARKDGLAIQAQSQPNKHYLMIGITFSLGTCA